MGAVFGIIILADEVREEVYAWDEYEGGEGDAVE